MDSSREAAGEIWKAFLKEKSKFEGKGANWLAWQEMKLSTKLQKEKPKDIFEQNKDI